jgi:hypothetical protein
MLLLKSRVFTLVMHIAYSSNRSRSFKQRGWTALFGVNFTLRAVNDIHGHTKGAVLCKASELLTVYEDAEQVCADCKKGLM